ncbi:conserved exported hypothetical protein [Nostocoides japonicum T1-X7]|uniref:Cardiolipin synthase N-terminal domain-containing protein n=1 Tax=Nostocoides japonicum T1-X7 TaxID=1194083 RepID=A0A077LWB7_9MICO|nr:PLDc N-terminal domain-containing protein [Tetrasphaera japonica]CCH77102.1 conserved exported hypothetical protein [Tetrasphaera japonica T1-X7]
MVRYLPLLLVLAVIVWALVECLQTPSTEVRALPKLVWVAVIVLLPILGAVAWFVAGRPTGHPGGGGSGRTLSRPMGPDDDPDFLRRL